MADSDDDAPTRGDYALYLIDELAALLSRTNLADWPERQATTFLKRLEQINAVAGSTAS